MNHHPANALFHALRKMAKPGFNGPVSDEDMARTRAMFPELMADLQRRRDAPRIDRSEIDYDGDAGREWQDNYDDNRR